MSRPLVVDSIAALRRQIGDWRRDNLGVAMVPTMGALHDGHISLVRIALERADRCVVSIFVNPTQFAPTEDFGSYPRTWKSDLARLAAENVDMVWHPSVQAMYPDGFATRIVPEGPALAGLEDRFRPHFFGGVATVVGKLFTQCRPDVAIFGVPDGCCACCGGFGAGALLRRPATMFMIAPRCQYPAPAMPMSASTTTAMVMKRP